MKDLYNYFIYIKFICCNFYDSYIYKYNLLIIYFLVKIILIYSLYNAHTVSICVFISFGNERSLFVSADISNEFFNFLYSFIISSYFFLCKVYWSFMFIICDSYPFFVYFFFYIVCCVFRHIFVK